MMTDACDISPEVKVMINCPKPKDNQFTLHLSLIN